MVTLRGNRGITLLQVLVVGTLGVIAAITLARVVSSTSKINAEVTDKISTESSVIEAQKFVRRLGRVAKDCTHVTTSGESLECNVDFNKPPTGVVTKIRFIMRSGLFAYQWATATPGVWKTKLTYTGVKNFTVCDSVQITNGTCSIESKALNKFIKTPSVRYFRYELDQVDGSRSEVGPLYSGAFYVRNPTPFGNGIVYQWD